MTHIQNLHKSPQPEEIPFVLGSQLKSKMESIEFTLIRDTVNKVTRVMEWRPQDTEKTFRHDWGISYHYTSNIHQFSSEQLESMQILWKNSFDNLVANQDWRENAVKIMEICAENKKELTHKEDIVLSDFTIWDRMEAHVLPRAHITCHSLLTCEINDELCAIYIIEGTTEKPVIWPFTTGWHIAVTDDIRDIIESRDKYSQEEFLAKMFSVIRNNMTKEIEEETGITLDPEVITYFQADQSDPKKTFIHIPENFTKVTKGNEESIHTFHAHLSKEQVAQIVADKEDGVEGHVAIPIGSIENFLANGRTLPLYSFDGKPFHFHNRSKFGSEQEFQEKSHLVSVDYLNQEIMTYAPNYISLFTNLVKKIWVKS
jgi:hypothetical protein